jgi:hypothetical protein
MQISPEVFGLGIMGIAYALFAALLAVDDFIVRDICAREGTQYTILWLFRSYWRSRVMSFRGGFKEAAQAGCFGLYTTLFVAWIVFILAIFIVANSGLVYSRPPLMSR